jgi:hypothetical protein
MKYFFALLLVLAAWPAPPSNNLSIDFTNRGETSAYVHWLLPPGLTTSPSSVNFGTVGVGASSTIGLTLLNDGTSAIQLLPLAISGTNANDFTFVSHCAQYLDINVQCQVNVTFKPSATGARTATLTIPFAGLGIDAPASMQITITKLLPPTNLTGTVKERT